MRLPSKSPITLGYGATTEPYSPATPHNGVDFAYIPDNTIYAPCDGLVSVVPNNGNDGNGIYMHDPEGRFHGMLHTSKYLVGNGDAVKEGQPIAVMGQSGFAQGVHCHWCVKENNQFIDPLTLVKGDDMFEGRSAADLGAQAEDAQKFKDAIVKSLSWKKIEGQIGGGMAENPDNIRPVIDSLEEFKDDVLKGRYKLPEAPSEVQINGIKYIPAK